MVGLPPVTLFRFCPGVRGCRPFTREPEPVVRHVKPKASGSVKFKGNLRSGVYIALVFCSREGGEVWTYDKVYVPTVLIDNESARGLGRLVDGLAWAAGVVERWSLAPAVAPAPAPRPS